MKKITLILALFFISIQVYATEYRGKIQSIGTGSYYDTRCSQQSCAVIMVSDAHSGPGCHSNSWDFIIRTDTDSGKATLSQALAAYAAGKEVVIGGTNSCNLMNNIEDLQYIYYKFQ